MEIQVKGLKELDNALSRFPDELQRKVLMQALRKAAKPMRDDVASRAPIRNPEEDHSPYLLKRTRSRIATAPGNLVASVTLRMRTIRGIPTALIGWRKRAFYGMFLEFGRSDQPAQPFMRPAFDAGYQQLLRDFAFELRLGIERAAKKFYKKAS